MEGTRFGDGATISINRDRTITICPASMASSSSSGGQKNWRLEPDGTVTILDDIMSSCGNG
jgi:hypothetical protein